MATTTNMGRALSVVLVLFLRREPLEEVGGYCAVETVTEDAHCSLRMHRLGYRSAYLKQPFRRTATETLSTARWSTYPLGFEV
ncbi:hypothetical protein O9929_11220 [Vibrio lentus]|nr:hypothetical protein [Vibrio lentus]